MMRGHGGTGRRALPAAAHLGELRGTAMVLKMTKWRK